ncbi:hypothetical protein [Sphingomonas sp. BK580]|uniref:hypothetical protein n=1 Tax=Sphingomonas sp. BK580 TaxID=2586972 RepID=UPI00161C047B|nr:hypothetical protein [Sphingomonas sp. BK580]MBB3693190.1 NAD kinase [Sphingomonas sp. BK580]
MLIQLDRDEAARQRLSAEASLLHNARCKRAVLALNELAIRSEEADEGRIKAASVKSLAGASVSAAPDPSSPARCDS